MAYFGCLCVSNKQEKYEYISMIRASHRSTCGVWGGVKSVMRISKTGISYVQYIPRIRPPIRFQAWIFARHSHNSYRCPLTCQVICYIVLSSSPRYSLPFGITTFSWFYATYPTWSSHACSPCRIYFVAEPHSVDSIHFSHAEMTRRDDMYAAWQSWGKYTPQASGTESHRRVFAGEQVKKPIHGRRQYWQVCVQEVCHALFLPIKCMTNHIEADKSL